MMSRRVVAIATLTVAFHQAFAADGFRTPVDVTVDTGSHTCTEIGWDKKDYQDVYAGDGRYFIDDKLSTVSVFGSGSCEYSPDHPNSYETRRFCVTDADGEKECTSKPVRVIIRAYADCTNNPTNLGSRVGTECRFTATSKRGNPE